jgi:hypothetical protein
MTVTGSGPSLSSFYYQPWWLIAVKVAAIFCSFC